MLEPTHDDYIEELLKRLRHAEEREQRHAIQALARLGRRAVPALLDALQGDDWTLRRHAATVFAEARDDRAIPLLCQALGDWDWEVRREAARALQAVAPPEAAEPLLTLFLSGEGHPQVRQIAIEALAAVAARDTLGQVPGSLWKRTIPVLCEVLLGPEWRLHGSAAGLLGTLRAEEAIDPLWAALGHVELEAALRVTVALGQIGGPRVIEPLRVALSHREADVRASAARALGRAGGEEAVMLLAWSLRSRDPFLRRGAARGIERLAKERPTPSLRAVLVPLRRLATPLVWPSSSEDRALYGRVLRLVERVTSQSRDLPLPCRAGAPSAQLPVPAPAGESRADEMRNATPDAGTRPRTWLTRLGARIGAHAPRLD